MLLRSFVACCAALACTARAQALEFTPQEIATDLTIGYAVSLHDVNADGARDIVVVDADRVLWYENPSWTPHVILQGTSERDNVCLDAYDLDGDGRLEFALGAAWRPADTQTGGTLQWLSPGADPTSPYELHPLSSEPTLHRLRWADLDGDGRQELVVVPLFGRGTTGPHYAEHPLRILAYRVPEHPRTDPWPVEVLSEELHVAHNFWPTDFDRDGRLDLLVASFEGVSLLQRGDSGWTHTLLGAGNQETSPNRGASEVKHGRLADEQDYIATIEPWHGFQVVVYTKPAALGELWTRRVLDDQLQWGHAVWCVDLDGDPDEELVIGVRDDASESTRCGVRIFDPQDAAGGAWERTLLDAGGVHVEDLTAGDLDNDGDADLVAVGRKSHNVRIYWNETAR